MTTYMVTIETDNAAFDGPFSELREVSRLLGKAIEAVDAGGMTIPLIDYNGNKVGEAGFIEEG